MEAIVARQIFPDSTFLQLTAEYEIARLKVVKALNLTKQEYQQLLADVYEKEGELPSRASCKKIGKIGKRLRNLGSFKGNADYAIEAIGKHRLSDEIEYWVKIANLTPIQHEVISLRYADQKFDAIAKQLDMSISSVDSIYSNARNKILKAMKTWLKRQERGHSTRRSRTILWPKPKRTDSIFVNQPGVHLQ